MAYIYQIDVTIKGKTKRHSGSKEQLMSSLNLSDTDWKELVTNGNISRDFLMNTMTFSIIKDNPASFPDLVDNNIKKNIAPAAIIGAVSKVKEKIITAPSKAIDKSLKATEPEAATQTSKELEDVSQKAEAESKKEELAPAPSPARPSVLSRLGQLAKSGVKKGATLIKKATTVPAVPVPVMAVAPAPITVPVAPAVPAVAPAVSVVPVVPTVAAVKKGLIPMPTQPAIKIHPTPPEDPLRPLDVPFAIEMPVHLRPNCPNPGEMITDVCQKIERGETDENIGHGLRRNGYDDEFAKWAINHGHKSFDEYKKNPNRIKPEGSDNMSEQDNQNVGNPEQETPEQTEETQSTETTQETQGTEQTQEVEGAQGIEQTQEKAEENPSKKVEGKAEEKIAEKAEENPPKKVEGKAETETPVVGGVTEENPQESTEAEEKEEAVVEEIAKNPKPICPEDKTELIHTKTNPSGHDLFHCGGCGKFFQKTEQNPKIVLFKRT